MPENFINNVLQCVNDGAGKRFSVTFYRISLWLAYMSIRVLTMKTQNSEANNWRKIIEERSFNLQNSANWQTLL